MIVKQPRFLPSLLPLRILAVAAAFALQTPVVQASIGQQSLSAQTSSIERTFAARAAIIPQITAIFPAVGLLAAAWATQHVRRRNARQLATNKS